MNAGMSQHPPFTIFFCGALFPPHVYTSPHLFHAGDGVLEVPNGFLDTVARAFTSPQRIQRLLGISAAMQFPRTGVHTTKKPDKNRVSKQFQHFFRRIKALANKPPQDKLCRKRTAQR